MPSDLMTKSMKIILDNQHQSGAYVACPNFDTYKYCWLRDGSFIANAMDTSGQYESAGKFFDWVDQVINKQDKKVENLVNASKMKDTLLNSDYLPTRYTLEGLEVEDEWPNFQLDGYGTWLWALAEHVKTTGEKSLIEKYRKSISITVSYLAHFYGIANYDCWEENGDKVHTSTLSCIYGGLRSISVFPGFSAAGEIADEIKQFVVENCVLHSRLVKYIGTDIVDASLLWAAVPFKLLEPDDVIMKNTVSAIESDLLHDGGVHRYALDTYYGGGEWILLSCWLGLYYAEAGERDKALRILEWVEHTANENGEFPEQVLTHVNNKEFIEKWQSLWGDVATPLLWSHAMYIDLKHNLS